MMLDTSRDGRDNRLTSRAYWLAGAAGALWVLSGTTALVTYYWFKAPHTREVHSLPYEQSSRYRLAAIGEKEAALRLPPFLQKKSRLKPRVNDRCPIGSRSCVARTSTSVSKPAERPLQNPITNSLFVLRMPPFTKFWKPVFCLILDIAGSAGKRRASLTSFPNIRDSMPELATFRSAAEHSSRASRNQRYVTMPKCSAESEWVLGVPWR